MAKQSIKKSINLNPDLLKRVEKAIAAYPGLTFTAVVNLALQQWLEGSQKVSFVVPSFIHDSSKGQGPQAKRS